MKSTVRVLPVQTGGAKTHYAMLLLAIILGSTLAFLPAPAFASTIKCGSTITVSTTLSADIGPCNNNGLFMGASGIVLNCAGHTISGTGFNKGINLRGLTQVTVKNCYVTGFRYGFILRQGSSNTLTGNTATGNGYGFYLKGFNNNTLAGNSANDNSARGFFLYRSDNNVLRANTANNDRDTGFFVSTSFSDRFTGNTADYNSIGFYLYNSSSNTLTTNVANGNGNGNGIVLYSSSNGNTITGNLANGNGLVGYFDRTTGSGTAGTANTYSFDECSSNGFSGSSPPGLCTPLS